MRCNQVKKEEGTSCAWTDAAAHNNKDRDNVAGPKYFQLHKNASCGTRDYGRFGSTELTRIRAALRPVAGVGFIAWPLIQDEGVV